VSDTPDRIGKYLVQGLIIRTDYSEVWRCRDPDLGVDVAVKVFHYKRKPGRDRIYGEAFWRERFLAEARVLAGLDHPHIIAVKELAEPEGAEPYFVMPYIEANLIYEIGPDVEKPRGMNPNPGRPRALALERAVFLLRQVFDAVAALHRLGIVHRDLKPGNVLLTRKRGGSVKLCDFGMVKTPDTSGSRAGVWVGTLDYMAPEQRKDATKVDARADVYSLGALAYRLLAGALPVGAFPPPHVAVPAVPRALSDLVMAALAPDRARRPANADVMLKRLEAIAATLPRPAPARPAARVVSITRVPPPKRA
jgi:serine/threonine-protein kinase